MARALAGQVAVVTGAGRGIGRAIARRVASEGAAVALVARTAEQLDSVAAEIEAEGGTCLSLQADLTVPDSARGVLKQAHQQLGPITLLVNNAGVSGDHHIPSLPADFADWQQVIDLNLVAPARLMQLVIPSMVERGQGCIINIGSYAGIRPMPGWSAYAASKAGLARLSDTLAAELDGSGVSVFTLSPGLVKTEMSARLPNAAEFPEDAWSQPDDCADMAVRLARGDADALSGSFLHVLDDLDSLIADAAVIQRDGLLRLRLAKLEGVLEP